MKPQNERADVYQRVTDQIIEAIERGAGQWRMPWHKGPTDNFAPTNAVSRKLYRGINTLNLWAIANKCGYGSALWATYAQWLQLAAQVRKGLGENLRGIFCRAETPSPKLRLDTSWRD